jgi:hypothetical protein
VYKDFDKELQRPSLSSGESLDPPPRIRESPDLHISSGAIKDSPIPKAGSFCEEERFESEEGECLVDRT